MFAQLVFCSVFVGICAQFYWSPPLTYFHFYGVQWITKAYQQSSLEGWSMFWLPVVLVGWPSSSSCCFGVLNFAAMELLWSI
ncbi:hypothetical protein U1Q18_039695, partial [Sarracenia purpurea var. burkii]